MVAIEMANTMIAKAISVARKLSKNDNAGITLKALCSAPNDSIATQAKKAQAVTGIPTIMNKTKILPFIC